MLTRIIYASTATKSFSADELQNVTDVCSLNNLRRHITGVLFYSGQGFLQALEGDDADLHDLLARLKSDHRHVDIKIIDHTQIAARHWPNWSLGYASSEGYNGVVADRYAGSDGRLDLGGLTAKQAFSMLTSLRVIRGPAAEADDLISQL
jgi:hypothetical protein